MSEDTENSGGSRGNLTRRSALQALAGAAAVSSVACASNATSKVEPTETKIPLAFKDPVWNRETSARLEADIAPGKFVHGYVTGVVQGVRDGERVKPLFGFDVFSGIRVLKQADGSYQRLCRELVFYRDLVTGEILEEWDNPYTNERVKVVDIANDPFNYILSEYYPEPPSYGGLNTEKPPRRPFLRNWGLINDTVTLDSDIHLYYRNALDPATWPRESAGEMNRVSEMFRYFMRREDVENPAMTHIPYNGVWNRVTPWLPWMLMGQSAGHIMYLGRFTTIKNPDDAPQPVIARVRERYPLYLTAPEVWEEPSLSSLENYARYQKPAPPK